MQTREILAARLADISNTIAELEDRKKILALVAANGDAAALADFKGCRQMQRALEEDAEPVSLALQQLS